MRVKMAVSKGGGKVDIPRSFKLLDELELGQKGSDIADISWGVEDDNDINMKAWRGSILGPPKTKFENRLYFLQIDVGDSYPYNPPTFRFKTKINMRCVDQSGYVRADCVESLNKWKSDYTISHILRDLHHLMTLPENRKVTQPPEGTCYF